MSYEIRLCGSPSRKEMRRDLAYVNKCAKAAERLNRRLFYFHRKEPRFTIKLFYSRALYDKEMKRKTPKYEQAASDKRRIAIFAPSVYERETTWKLRIYRSTMIHEVSHMFYMQGVGAYTPLWLLEGLAMNTEGRDYAEEFKKWHGKPKMEYLYFAKHAKSEAEALEFYRSSYLMTRALIRKIGMGGLIALLSRYSKNPVRPEYERLFGRFLSRG